MASLQAQSEGKPSTYGRPRLLTHDEILDAATEMGLETLTMKKLATQLGVGTATLYQYFDSRKSLMRAAAVHMLSDLPLPQDEGQHWVVLARDYMRTISDLLAENSTFLQSYQHSDYGFEVHFRLIEAFLEAVVKRGFEPAEGMELFNTVGMVAFARAVEKTRQREFEYFDETMTSAAERQLERLDNDTFPLIHASLNVFTRDPDRKINRLFESAVLSVARERGESDADIMKALKA